MILLDPELEPDPRPHGRIPSARTLDRFLIQAQSALRLRGEVSVLLTTDRAILRLNRQFRGKDRTTDVLSFPASDLLQNQEEVAGDLAISVDTARNQGAACGHPLGVEIKMLMLHGLLHLAGYDHETDEGRMARRELQLRARLGLPLGLIERATSESASKRGSKPARRCKP